MAIDKNLTDLILPNIDKQATSDVKNLQEFKKVLSNDDSTMADIISAAGKFGIKFIGDKTIGQVVDRAVAGTNLAKNTVNKVNKALNTTVGEVKGKPKSEAAKQKEVQKSKEKTTTTQKKPKEQKQVTSQPKATSASNLTSRYTGSSDINRNVGTKQSTEYIKKLIVDEAKRQGVPPELALAVAQHESGFNNTAISPKNKNGSRDHGVFQLNDKYHHLNNVYDPVENVRYGVGMLRDGLKRNNGDIAATLRQYNTGSAKPSTDGNTYANKVMALLPQYNQNTIDTIAASNPVPQGTLDGDGNLIANNPNITGAAAPIPRIDEVMGIQTSPNQMYNDMTKYRDTTQKDAKTALKYAQNRLMPTQAQALLNKTFGAGIQDYQNAYNQQIANIDKAYQDVQNTRATNDQELMAKFQAMRDLAAQDPRLQNQGYYLDPRVIQSQARGQAALAAYGINPNLVPSAADIARQQYETQIANQYGVPYQEYLDSRLGNINNNMRISQGEIEYLAARAAAGDTLAQQRLQTLQAANTSYTSGLANVGKLDAENAKTAISGLLTGNNQLLNDFMTAYTNADTNTQQRINEVLTSLISGQSGTVQSGISANSAETVAGINQQAKMQELPSQIELNKANALKARGEGQMYGVAGGLDEGQASVINYGENYIPVNPNANRQSQPLILWGGNNGGFFNLGGNR